MTELDVFPYNIQAGPYCSASKIYRPFCIWDLPYLQKYRENAEVHHLLPRGAYIRSEQTVAIHLDKAVLNDFGQTQLQVFRFLTLKVNRYTLLKLMHSL